MDMEGTESTAKKISFDPTKHVAEYDCQTNMLIWSNGKKWMRKGVDAAVVATTSNFGTGFGPFRVRWRDPQGHVVSIEEDGTVRYIVPKSLGAYKSKVVGFFKISIAYQNHTFRAELTRDSHLRWDNGVLWKRVGGQRHHCGTTGLFVDGGRQQARIVSAHVVFVSTTTAVCELWGEWLVDCAYERAHITLQQHSILVLFSDCPQ